MASTSKADDSTVSLLGGTWMVSQLRLYHCCVIWAVSLLCDMGCITACIVGGIVYYNFITVVILAKHFIKLFTLSRNC